MRQTVILAAVAIASAMVGQSFATERASDALISACVDPNGGVSIPPSGACQSGATSLSWSQQGPPGLPGPQGPPGPATPASLPISVPAIHLAATPKLVSQRSGISTSVALAGDGTTHLLDGSVTVHVPAQTWTHKRVIVCDLSGPGSAPLDRQVRAIEAHGAPLTYDVHLTGGSPGMPSCAATSGRGCARVRACPATHTCCSRTRRSSPHRPACRRRRSREEAVTRARPRRKPRGATLYQ